MATEKHAIICGFGRSGQYLARYLAQEGVSYVALDLDPERVQDAAAAGENVVYGDASQRENLMKRPSWVRRKRGKLPFLRKKAKLPRSRP